MIQQIFNEEVLNILTTGYNAHQQGLRFPFPMFHRGYADGKLGETGVYYLRHNTTSKGRELMRLLVMPESCNVTVLDGRRGTARIYGELFKVLRRVKKDASSFFWLKEEDYTIRENPLTADSFGFGSISITFKNPLILGAFLLVCGMLECFENEFWPMLQVREQLMIYIMGVNYGNICTEIFNSVEYYHKQYVNVG